MAGVSRSRNDTTLLHIVDGTDIVMAKLEKYEVARLEGIIDALPAALTDITARRTACHRHILPRDLQRVEDDTCLRAPTPHAVCVLVLVLHRRVACDKDHRLTCLTTLAVGWQLYVDHHRLKGFQLRVRRVVDALCGRARVELGTIGGGVDMVTMEMVLFLPMAEAVEFRT